jgi:hypothetical protein
LFRRGTAEQSSGVTRERIQDSDTNADIYSLLFTNPDDSAEPTADAGGSDSNNNTGALQRKGALVRPPPTYPPPEPFHQGVMPWPEPQSTKPLLNGNMGRMSASEQVPRYVANG